MHIFIFQGIEKNSRGIMTQNRFGYGFVK
jgi:hypothetical protein